MRVILKVIASLLLIQQVQAHNPGLSTLDVRIATNGIGVNVGFAPSDLEALELSIPLDAMATQVCVVEVDGVSLKPLYGGFLTNTPGDRRFGFVYPPMTGQHLRVGCPLLARLPEAHRQYLTVSRLGGELLAERLLNRSATDAIVDVAPPVDITLPKFIATKQKRLLTLAEQLALLGAILAWGAAHAMTPGHGKAMVAAYLVGSRGTPWHAVALGLTVTATHTLGIFALGLLTLFAANRVSTEKLYPWLAAVSGLLVALVGATMLYRRLRGSHHHHHHGHDHHHHGSDHHHHDDHHDYDHQHDHAHPHEHGHEHTGAVTWRQLIGLGVSGGLVPCPAALVLLLTSVSMDRVAFGLLLVLAFSLGLAGVLILVGLLVVRGARVLDRWPTFQRLSRVLPLVSATLILVLGVVLCVRAIPR